ncbi:MAG: response regulator [Calditrichaeota bacterium]|nr:MAG: response regulator [Calditrichota bacterium]
MTLNDLVILLVEDNANDVILIRRALQEAKVLNPLQVVKDGEQAIAYLKGEGKYADRAKYPLPVLLLLDLKLPRVSGFDVLEWLRKQKKLARIPVVVLTSSNQSQDVNRAYDLGANSYLVKPVEFDDLVKLLKTLGLYWIILNEKPEP